MIKAMFSKNPFVGKLALQNSSYSSFKQDNLVLVETECSPSQQAQSVHQQLRTWIESDSFSCVLGKAAIAKNTYRFGFYKDMDTEEALAGLSYDLFKFVHEQTFFSKEYNTFIASFSGPITKGEEHFESIVWDFLNRLSRLDASYHPCDPAINPDPQSPDYSYSFAQRAFFLVGLHANSSRLSRRFTWPTIVFNAHYQFENLRETGKFKKFQELIRTKDIKLQGNINPNLTNFGEDSEAKQYTGRHVEKDWVCPHFIRKQEERK